MGNKSYRIKTTAGGSDKYLKVKLEQETDLVEILSLKITQKDIYASFNADFGVLVGRVLANGGIGIPNAKISIFIPITDDDKTNSEIASIYPYTNPRDKNADGVRYNLLPRVAVNNPFNTAGQFTPAVPVGTFPTKEEITTNETFLEVYKKYFKYTTVTNTSGDYMIYGVPVGLHTVHMSVDVTDIGDYSMTPGTMVSQLGYSPVLFENNKVKFSTDLDTIPNIETQNISVDIRPFWGDRDNFEIGITRQDFKIRATLVSSVTVFGAGFTDNFYASYGRDDYFGDRDDSASAMSQNEGEYPQPASGDAGVRDGVKYNVGVASRRNGLFEIEVYTIPNTVTMNEIQSGDFNTTTDIQLLDKSQYNEILDDGMFILTLPCNRAKKVVNEFGELVDTTDDDPNGIFTQFVGMFIIDYGPELSQYQINNVTDRSQRSRQDRTRIKIPQSAPDPVLEEIFGLTFEASDTFSTERDGNFGGKTKEQRIELNERWRKQAFNFEGGKIYSVAKFYGTAYEDQAGARVRYSMTGDTTNKNLDVWRNAGGLPQLSSGDTAQEFPYNVTNATYNFNWSNAPEPLISNVKTFAGEWLNMCIYFPQIFNYTGGEQDVTRMLTTDYAGHTDMTIENTYNVVGTRKDTSYFLRSDIHQSTFIEVPKADLVNIIQNAPDKKGFTSADPEFLSNPLSGSYQGLADTKYFYRGLHDADVITFLQQNGIISA